MIPETENPQEAKSVYPGKPSQHAQADPGRYFTQRPQCWIYRGTAYISDGIQTHLQQTTFENILAKILITLNEHVLLLPDCFQLYSIIMLSLTKIALCCLHLFRVVCCRFVVCGKGVK